MLGSVGEQPELVELLQRETEGNVFFIVEMVRALAEERGQLDQITANALPEHISAGGVKRIVQRRLDHVPPQNPPMLQSAPLAGRFLDLKTLANVQPTLDPKK